MFKLIDFETVVKEKFINNEALDYKTKNSLSETETVKEFINDIKAEGIEINTFKDIPLLFYLLRYSDDDYNLKYVYKRDINDQMQTARLTLLTLRGDCEDVHRFYNAAALNFIDPENIKILVLFFGDETGITGGHATSLIVSGNQYINTDYNWYITSNSLNGILTYISDCYSNVHAYVILGIERIEDIIYYKIESSGYYTERANYYPEKISQTGAIKAFKNHLYRNAESTDNIKIVGLSLLALVIGLGGKFL